MIKKILSAVIAMVTLATPVLGYAQTQTSQPVNQVPDIYVQNLRLQRPAYSAGDVVTGTFELVNSDSVGISDVQYKVSLAGMYDAAGDLQDVYNSKIYSPVFLNPGERRLTTFVYTLPKAFSGDSLQIHVQAMLKSGTPLGWGDAPIKVTGGLPTLSTTQVFLTVDGQKFPASVGPTIHADSTTTPTVTISVENSSPTSLTLTPHIRIYDRSTTGATLKNAPVDPITLASKEKKDLVYPIELFSGKAGVYVAQVDFVDENNIARAQPVQFRYIVSGDIVTITSVTAGKSSVAIGDTLPVTVNYAGVPYDLVPRTEQQVKAAGGDPTLDVKAYNEKNELIGSYSGTQNFNQDTSKTVNITAAVAAQALRADITITRGGKIIASYSTKLTGNYDVAQQNALQHPELNRTQQIVIALVTLLIIIVLIIGVIRFVNMRRARALMSLLIIFTTVAYLFLPYIQSANAYTVTSRQSYNAEWDYQNIGAYPANNTYCNPSGGNCQSSWPTKPNFPGYWNPNNDHSWLAVAGCYNGYPSNCESNLSPTVTINTPTSGTALTPGQTFNLTGSVYALGCLNSAQEVFVSATFNGTTKTQDKTNINNFKLGYHDVTTGSTNFSLNGFTAPMTPGTYTLTFEVDNYTNYPDYTYSGHANRTGYRTVYGASANMTAPPTVAGYTPPVQPGGGLYSHESTGGYVMASMTITVGTQLPTVSISASPTSVSYGSASTLTWATTNNPTSCTASDGWSGSKAVGGGSQSTGALGVTTRYTITCTNSAGSASASATVTVGAQPCTVTYTVTPSVSGGNGSISPSTAQSVSSGGSQTFTMTPNSGYQLSQILVNGISQTVSNPYTISNVTSNTTFTASFTTVPPPPPPAPTPTPTPPPPSPTPTDTPSPSSTDTPPPSGYGYNYDDTVQPAAVLLAQATPCTPTVSLYAASSTVAYGGSTLLTWYSNNADYCTSSDFATSNATSNSSGVSTGALTNPPTASKTYTITCYNTSAGTNASASVAVAVGQQAQTVAATCYPTTPGHTNPANPPKSAYINTVVTWVASVTSPASYTLLWSGDEMPAGRTANTSALTYTSIGTKAASVTVTPAIGPSSVITCQYSPFGIKPLPIFQEI